MAANRTQARLPLALPALLTLLLMVLASGIYALSTWPAISDFTKFYASAEQLARGEDMYAQVALDAYGPPPPNFFAAHQTLDGNLNPPAVTVLLLPFVLLPIRTALQVWAVLSIGLGLLSCWLLWQSLNLPPRRLASLLWLWCAFLLYIPTLRALQLGQLTFLTFLLLVLAWREMRAGRESTVGLWLGLAVSIKIFLGLVVVYCLIRRRWRVVIIAGLVFAATTLAGALAAGWQSYVRYAETLGTVVWQAAGMNGSLAGLFARLLGGSTNPPLLGALARWLTNASTLASLGVLSWLAWPRTAMRENEVDALGLGVAFCFALLISPLGWSYYFPILLVAVYPAWKENFYGSKSARWLILSAVVLSALPLPTIGIAEGQGLHMALLGSINFAALLACTSGLALAYHACRRRADVPAAAAQATPL